MRKCLSKHSLEFHSSLRRSGMSLSQLITLAYYVTVWNPIAIMRSSVACLKPTSKKRFSSPLYIQTHCHWPHTCTHMQWSAPAYHPIQYSYNIVSCTTHGWTQNQEVVDNTAMATTKRVPHQKPKHITSWLNTLEQNSSTFLGAKYAERWYTATIPISDPMSIV